MLSVAGTDQTRVAQVLVVLENEGLGGGVEPEMSGDEGETHWVPLNGALTPELTDMTPEEEDEELQTEQEVEDGEEESISIGETDEVV